jgi:hypothetical protein
MKPKSIILLLLTGLLTFSCKKDECTCDPITIKAETLAITVDAQISDHNPTGTHGSYGIISAQAWTVGGNPATQRALINPDLSSIPSGATITKANLVLRGDADYNYAGGAVYGHSQLNGSNAATLRRITSSWNESSVTWNTKPTTDDINAVQIPASTSADQIYTINVLQLVKDQYTNPSSYFGFCIQLNTETYYRSLIFASSDGDADLKPTLEIEYTY